MIDLRLGDCFEVMKTMPDNSVDSVVTDPPYGLVSIVKRFGKDGSKEAKQSTDGRFNRLSKGFMGKEWDGSGIEYNVEMWEEVLRIIKPGGYLLAFGGSRTYHRLACAIEDAGFEIRDQIQWVYGSGFPKSHNAGDGWGTALKPAHEPIVMARKSLSENTVLSNIEKWGTGAINIKACRIPGESVPINKLQKWSGFGELKRPDFEQTVNNAGRWPANFIHDGSDEVVEMFPIVTSGKPAGKKHAKNKIYGQYKTEIDITGYGDTGSAARFYYCAKASKDDRGINNNHPTVKPTELMQYLCRLVTPENGIVFDPFMGSGSTGVGAKIAGFSFIGIEKDANYLAISENRIHSINRLF